MNLQTFLVLAAVGLSALYFLWHAYRDLSAPQDNGCGTCPSGGCPVARKG